MKDKAIRTWIDARGIPVTLPAHPQRIVSLICSITETLFDFGLGGRLVGRTNYCIHPRELVDSIMKIGRPKNPDHELIVAQNPDLVFANIEENEKPDIEAIERAGIPVFVTYPRSVHDGHALLKTLGAITDTERAAEPFYEQMAAVMSSVQDKVRRFFQRPTVLYLIWRKPYMTINRDTFIHDMITFCGGINVFAEHLDRYPSISIDDIVARQPDIVFLPSEPFKFNERHKREIMEIDELSAVRRDKVLFADGELFSWYGTRMIHGLPYVHKLLSYHAGTGD